MDLRTLTKLILKLAGIYLVLTALIALPSVFNLPRPYSIDTAVALSLYIIVGLALIWFPGAILNTIIRMPASEAEGTVTATKLLQVGLMLLGAYFAVAAVSGLVFAYAKARLFYDVVKPFGNSPAPDMNPTDFGHITASAVEFALGLALWFGRRHLARVVGRFNDDR